LSWLIASFALVTAVLAIGWVAHERSRPSARTVALVATLSALTALGRDAFAALDEVKPITAMTFVVGYSLGPLPGFVVGAVGMLASDLLLGEGPYTPWQMAAWGLVGLLGALAGMLSRRRLRRLALALCCAFAALLAKETMNLYEWSVGGTHTPAALLAAAARGLPFDVVDVVSTLLFGLAFGPELARLLARVRARTSVEWAPVEAGLPLALAIVAGVCLAGGLPARASAAGASTAEASAPRAMAGSASSARAAAAGRGVLAKAISYLRHAQKGDGGFGAEPGAASTEMYTAWTAVGLAAAGEPPLTVTRDRRSPLDALRAEAHTLSGAGDVERTIVALHACGVWAGALAGRDLAAQLARFRAADGSFSGQVSLTAFGIFALRALGRGAGDPQVRVAGRWLLAQQNADGGFSFGVHGDPSDVDDTAAAIEGAVAAGAANARALPRAISYLRRAENRDGGFPQQRGGESNAQSTAWAVQGLVAAKAPLAAGGRSPIAYLDGLAAPDGSIRYAEGVEQTPVWVTAEAVAALARRSFPIAAPAAASTSGDGRAGAPTSDRASGAPSSQAKTRTRRSAAAPASRSAATAGGDKGRMLASWIRKIMLTTGYIGNRFLIWLRA
jgi:energy-coupling factor transport system substrate-specific component